MADEKDRLGQKMRDVEAAREEQWARQQDAKLVEKMRQRLSEILCPHCKKALVAKSHGSLRILACPSGAGAWLDESALKVVLKAQK